MWVFESLILKFYKIDQRLPKKKFSKNQQNHLFVVLRGFGKTLRRKWQEKSACELKGAVSTMTQIHVKS